MPKVDILNPSIKGWGEALAKPLNCFIREQITTSELKEMVSLLCHEAILRNHIDVVKTLMRACKPTLSAATFLEYLKDKKITREMHANSKNALLDLVNAGLLKDTDAKFIEEIFSKKSLSEKANISSKDSFPPSLQPHLEKNTSSLQDLYKEFIQVAFNISPSSFASTTTSTQEEEKAISLMKSHLYMRTFSTFSKKDVFPFFAKSFDSIDKKESEAAILLAQLLYFHGSTSIEVGGNIERWLNDEAQKNCLALLHDWDEVPYLQKLSLRTQHETENRLATLEAENQKLKETASNQAALIKILMTNVENLQAQMNMVLSSQSSNLANNNPTITHQYSNSSVIITHKRSLEQDEHNNERESKKQKMSSGGS